MDARTIATRLREIAGGAEMIATKNILAYTGTDYEWLNKVLREHQVKPIGKGIGKRYHILDVAKALAT